MTHTTKDTLRERWEKFGEGFFGFSIAPDADKQAIFDFFISELRKEVESMKLNERKNGSYYQQTATTYEEKELVNAVLSDIIERLK